jgi:hypothetical protein
MRGRKQNARNLPASTSGLLDLQAAAERELNSRFKEIFHRHKGLAFIHRQDHVFHEHWTPERAAAGYEFSGYEIRDQYVLLHGVEVSAGFNYQISISFPRALVDSPKELAAHFERRYAAGREIRSSILNSAEGSRVSSI